MQTINKADIAKELADSKFDAVTIETITMMVFKQIAQHLSEGKQVRIDKFGAFTPKARNARNARNPKTGEVMRVPAKSVPTFQASSVLKDLLKEAGHASE